MGKIKDLLKKAKDWIIEEAQKVKDWIKEKKKPKEEEEEPPPPPPPPPPKEMYPEIRIWIKNKYPNRDIDPYKEFPKRSFWKNLSPYYRQAIIDEWEASFDYD